MTMITTMTDHTDDGQPLAREGGDGSLSSGDTIKDENTEQYNWRNRGDKRTTFYASDADKHGFNEELFDRLWRYHVELDVIRGEDNVFEGSDNRGERDKRRLVENFSQQLEISESIQESAVAIALDADGRRFNKVGGLEAICLGSIVLAQNRWWEGKYREQALSGDADLEQILSYRIQNWEDSDGNKILPDICEQLDVNLSKTLKLLKQ